VRYANSNELTQFHDSFLAMCEKHAKEKTEEEWGYPGGFDFCGTYNFDTKYGPMYIGHIDKPEMSRYWIPIILEEQVTGYQLSVTFEMCIPKTKNLRLSVHYTIDDSNIIQILHKGKFTLGHGSLSMADFFDFYRKNPAKWQVIKFNGYDYLVLSKVNLVMTDTDFTELLDSLAEFAKYIPSFKNKYRG